MKPDWKDAPEWANWLAQDLTGAWYWYERRPNLLTHAWDELTGGKIQSVDHPSWSKSLEERPHE